MNLVFPCVSCEEQILFSLFSIEKVMQFHTNYRTQMQSLEGLDKIPDFYQTKKRQIKLFYTLFLNLEEWA